MEIDITSFITGTDTWAFSGSVATHGANAGPNTWNAAKDQASREPLLNTEEELDALLNWAKETGAWDAEERASWSKEEINALFIQLIAGDMRECGMDAVDLEGFDWAEYEARASEGQISGNIFKADDGRIFYAFN
jgi:hypothetical protein